MFYAEKDSPVLKMTTPALRHAFAWVFLALCLCGGAMPSEAQGRVSMADLLERLRHGGQPAVESSVAAEDHLLIKTPRNSRGWVRVPVSAFFGGVRSEDRVEFVVHGSAKTEKSIAGTASDVHNGLFDAVLEISLPHSPEPVDAVRVGARLNPVAGGEADAVCTPESGLEIEVQYLAENSDRDANGAPDQPITLETGELWWSVTEQGRLVSGANLDNGPGGTPVTLTPAEGLEIRCPNLETLLASGVLPECADADSIEAVAFAATAASMADLTDTIDGDTRPEMGTVWETASERMMDAHPWPSADGLGQFAAVTMLYTLDGGATYNTVPSLAQSIGGQSGTPAATIEIVWSGPELPQGEALFSYPVELLPGNEGMEFTGHWGPDGNWSGPTLPETDANGRIHLLVQTPGVFAWGALPTRPATVLPETPPQPETAADPEPLSEALRIDSIAPAQAWIFGGVAATITGAGFAEGMEVHFGGRKALLSAVLDSGTAKVLVPPSADISTAATVPTPLTVRLGESETQASIPFTYSRHRQDTEAGLFMTAFVIDAPHLPTPGIAVPLASAPSSTCAYLDFPALNPDGGQSLYGLACFAQVQGSPLDGSPLGTGQLPDLSPESGQAIPGAWDFSVHLYVRDAKAAELLPELASGYETLEELAWPPYAGLRGMSSHPCGLSVTFPVPPGTLSYRDLAQGFYSLWSIESRLDYATEQHQTLTQDFARYQSQVLANEVSPAYMEGQALENGPDMVLHARLYDGNTFSLRRGATLPAKVAAGIRLNLPEGAARGPLDGGQPLPIVSPMGGLGWANQVIFSRAGDLENSPPLIAAVAHPGRDEYTIEVLTPQSPTPGTYSLAVQLKEGAPPTSVALGQRYEFKAADTPAWVGPASVVAGLTVALVGLAAGGDSGGSGGGPCFIATAAYGTPWAEEINVLRKFRDVCLLSSSAGTAFVDTYYRTSPQLAECLAGHPALRACVRFLLIPVVWVAHIWLAAPAAILAVPLCWAARRLFRRVKQH